MRSNPLKATFALLVLSSTACSIVTQPGDPPAQSTVAVQGVRVTPQSIQLAAIGATRQLMATVAPANATDQAITWESADANVVSVDANGLVTATGVGSGVFITATTHDGQHQSSANVSVGQ